MMSVMVKGMKMPKRCFDCGGCEELLSSYSVQRFFCAFSKGMRELKGNDNSNRIPYWCPLVEIVNCGECKHYHAFRGTDGGIGVCGRLDHPLDPKEDYMDRYDDDFCSRGERK